MEHLFSVEIIKKICQCCLQAFPSLHSTKFQIIKEHKKIFHDLTQMKVIFKNQNYFFADLLSLFLDK